jgi:hypothetical protein
MKAVIAGLAALALSACGSTSKVVRAGPDTYMISSGGGMYEQNPSGIRQTVYERANAYCGSMGKTMTPVATDEQPYALGRHTANVSLTFKCGEK